MAKSKALYLVDGSSYLFRAYHALPPLSTSRGEPTGALYGVANMLRKWVKDESPQLLGVIFDAPGKTFRHDMYAEYKANRPPMPDDLRAQLEPLLELVEASGMPLLRVPDVEADDVLATLARRAAAEGRDVVISTSDKDLAQLVTDKITLVNTMSNTRMDIDGVKDKFGVRPDQIIDYLALIGDSVDNVPGVPKVGPKTAAKWLAEYDTLDAIMADADSFKGKIGQYLRDSLETLPLSRDLVTVKDDVELDAGPGDLALREPDREKLRKLYGHWEFTAWLNELESEQPAAEAVEMKTVLVDSEEELDRWVEKMRKADVVAVDTETDSLDSMRAELVGISLAVHAGEAAYIPVAHRYPGAPAQLDRDLVIERLKPVLEDPDIAIVGQHFKYDMLVLGRYGVTVRGYRYDTMLESYVLNSSVGRHDMDTLAERYLQRTTTHFEDIAGKGAKQISFADVDLDSATQYAAEDADVTLQLHQTLWPRIAEQDGPKYVFESIEMPLAPVLAAIERRGVLVDTDKLKALSKEFAERMVELEKDAEKEAGQPFNIGSTKQLGELLFDKLQLPVIRKTPKGQPSTAEDVLEELGREYALPRLIIQHRQLSKLKSTYTDKLPEQINPDTGRIHTSYHQAVAATGRLSSSDPNLQNIPIRNEEGRRIRRAFVAPKGWKIVAADYSQIELRIMAHLSGDEGLRKAFKDGLDIHAATAAEVFGGEPESVDPDHRRAAKAINFGLIYGMSAFGLSKQLGVERKEAQEYINIYFGRYPGVKDYMENTRKSARDKGYVETIAGRRLYLPEINARNFQRRSAAERAAINAPMQGTAADIIKRAMIEIDQWLNETWPDDVNMTMQVHDELVFEVRENIVEEFCGAITQRMSAAAELSIPLLVEAGVGDNWEEAH